MLKIGGGDVLMSLIACQLPCTNTGKDVIVEDDILDSANPLLLSLQLLKKANARLTVESDSAEIFATEVPLYFT